MTTRKAAKVPSYGYVILSLDSEDMRVPHYNTLKEAQKDFSDWGCDARLLALSELPSPRKSKLAALEKAVLESAMRGCELISCEVLLQAINDGGSGTLYVACARYELARRAEKKRRAK